MNQQNLTGSGKLSGAALALRIVSIGVIVGGVAGLFAYAGGWLTPRDLTPSRFADGFQWVNGPHPGFRRNHAKGVCISGSFESNGAGTALCKSSVFRPGRIPMIGRFSFGGGQPEMPDAPHTVRGLAIRFGPPDGQEWRTAMLNLPVFPVRTPQAFYDQMFAAVPDAQTGKPVPGKLEAFLSKYPESAKAREVIMSHPMSSGFGNSTFNSLNAFRFVNDRGESAWVRWSMIPVEPFQPIEATDSARSDKNYLFDALIAEIHQHPRQWHLIITVAQSGDATDDATLPWPPERQQIDVGTLTVDHVESEDTSPARDLNFDPLILPDGMAPSNDPLLSARSAVYSQSFTRREGEPKHPSAISPDETRK